jgi:hypothetical protein
MSEHQENYQTNPAGADPDEDSAKQIAQALRGLPPTSIELSAVEIFTLGGILQMTIVNPLTPPPIAHQANQIARRLSTLLLNISNENQALKTWLEHSSSGHVPTDENLQEMW